LDEADGLEPIFPIVPSFVLPLGDRPFEDAASGREIEAMLEQVRGTLRLVPLEAVAGKHTPILIL
jgi:hypothetical protein